MNFKEAFASLVLKFTSGNDMPVERATILNTEWEAIRNFIFKLQKEAHEDVQE